MKKKRILAITLARGGSKGVPKKNIRKLAGHPLIYYTIVEALKSKLIDRGEEVLDIAEKAYPNETKAVIKKLSELIKQGKIQNLISGGELLSIFRNLGLNFSVSTSISVSKDGKITSLSDKLKNEE